MDSKVFELKCKKIIDLVLISKKGLISRQYVILLKTFDMDLKRNFSTLKLIDKFFKAHQITYWNNSEQLKSLSDFKKGDIVTFKRKLKSNRTDETKTNLLENMGSNFTDGYLWEVYLNDDLTEPQTQINFRKNIFELPESKLNRGFYIKKQNNVEQHLLLDFINKEYEPSFKLFLYDDNTASGTIIYYSANSWKKEYFKGNFKILNKHLISIWGSWSVDAERKQRHLTYIELNY
jgi:hypothetical protein